MEIINILCQYKIDTVIKQCYIKKINQIKLNQEKISIYLLF